MDDIGYIDPQFANGLGYTIPNMDKLAAEGMRFINFYAAQATCTASRAGILTGCYPNRISMYGAFGPTTKDALNPEEETIASLLKRINYHREGKGTSFEGGQREPCVINWPGHIPPGTVCNKLLQIKQ